MTVPDPAAITTRTVGIDLLTGAIQSPTLVIWWSVTITTNKSRPQSFWNKTHIKTSPLKFSTLLLDWNSSFSSSPPSPPIITLSQHLIPPIHPAQSMMRAKNNMAEPAAKSPAPPDSKLALSNAGSTMSEATSRRGWLLPFAVCGRRFTPPDVSLLPSFTPPVPHLLTSSRHRYGSCNRLEREEPLVPSRAILHPEGMLQRSHLSRSRCLSAQWYPSMCTLC